MRLFTESWWNQTDYLVKVEITELSLRKIFKYERTTKNGVVQTQGISWTLVL